MRHLVVIAAALLLLAGCKPGEEGGQPPVKPRIDAGQAKPPANPGPEPGVNEPGPVRGDPSACGKDGQVELKAGWKSETDKLPQIEWQAGAVSGTAPDSQKVLIKAKTGIYGGLWTVTFDVHCGMVVGFTMFGTPSFTFSECYIMYKGQAKGYQGGEGMRHCASSFTVT